MGQSVKIRELRLTKAPDQVLDFLLKTHWLVERVVG